MVEVLAERLLYAGRIRNQTAFGSFSALQQRKDQILERSILMLTRTCNSREELREALKAKPSGILEDTIHPNISKEVSELILDGEAEWKEAKEGWLLVPTKKFFEGKT